MTNEELTHELDVLTWEAMFWSNWLPYNQSSSIVKNANIIANAFSVAGLVIQFNFESFKSTIENPNNCDAVEDLGTSLFDFCFNSYI